MVDVISIGRELLSVIRKAMEIAEQRKQNNSILEELQRFYQDLDVNIGHLQEKALCSNSAKWALGKCQSLTLSVFPTSSSILDMADALQKDLKYALGEAGKILKKGFLRSLWNANKIQTRIQGLRERVMTSFQTRLSIASLDVALESKHDQDAFRAAMLNVNNELQAMYIATSASLKEELRLALRRQLGKILRTIMSAMESQSNKTDGAASMISSIEPQTSDAEKFREDVLAALNVLSARDAATQYDAKRGASSSTVLKSFQDPVTWETMCDAVKATDGHTYDRWTILDGNDSANSSAAAADIDAANYSTRAEWGGGSYRYRHSH